MEKLNKSYLVALLLSLFPMLLPTLSYAYEVYNNTPYDVMVYDPHSRCYADTCELKAHSNYHVNNEPGHVITLSTFSKKVGKDIVIRESDKRIRMGSKHSLSLYHGLNARGSFVMDFDEDKVTYRVH